MREPSPSRSARPHAVVAGPTDGGHDDLVNVARHLTFLVSITKNARQRSALKDLRSIIIRRPGNQIAARTLREVDKILAGPAGASRVVGAVDRRDATDGSEAPPSGPRSHSGLPGHADGMRPGRFR
jgi:hypothetical protein